MRDYHDYERIYLGYSDIASLTIVGPRDFKDDQMGSLAESLYFGIDGDYYAYIVDGDAEIGGHYKLVQTCEVWMKVYDDEGLVKTFRAPKINIYRAGDAGCIIQKLDN